MRAGEGRISFPERMGRRRGSWCTGLLLFLLASCASLNAAPMVTIIDDDARSIKAIESVKSVADRHGVKVTFAAVASFLQKTPEVASKLQEDEKEGHEVAAHSLTHRAKVWQAGAATDLRAIEAEIIDAEAVFKGFDLHPRTFVYPFGSFPRAVRPGIFKIVSKYYPAAFNARGDINLPGNFHPLYMSRHPMRKHNSIFMVKRLIDEAAAADRSWVVILTHSANSDFSAAMLEEIIRYAKQTGAVFLPASQAWQQAASWPQISEESIPAYDKLDDYLNAAYFHLPYLLAAGTAGTLLAGGLIFLLLRRRNIKNHSARE